ncbi:MAG: dihydrodipicolinate reductase, partial [Candidatus Dadabacteria bacterium]|nr:dihydrodipicolinate reductase [Candidatus Dadabacteria bacterium]
MIKVAITGVAGRMGGRILSLLQEEDGIKIVGATEKEGHSSIGKDIGNLAGGVKIGVQVSDRIEVAATNADAIIDFTTAAVTLSNAFYASKKGKAMVVGTTGFLEEEKKRFEKLAKGFACVVSPNMSIGVNVMFEVSRMIAKYLGTEFDVEIIEAHH